MLKDFTVERDSLYEIACEARVHKSGEEQALMQWANIVGQMSHKYIWKRMRPGLTELQISNFFTSSIEYLANGTNPYGNICACDASAASLHYMDGREQMVDGKLILIDCGARVNMYNSDITRTIPINGKFTPKQKEVYDIVIGAQEAVYSMVDVGVEWLDCHIESEKTVIKGLQGLGMIKKTINGKEDLEAIWKTRVVFYFYPHGLGHYMGLNTHDLPGDKAKETDPRIQGLDPINLRVTRKLEENMIFSNEPGIYFAEHLMKACKAKKECNDLVNWDKVAEYMQEVRGIRVEDNFIVKKNGCAKGNYINLTAGLPKKTEDIERFMASDQLYMDEFMSHY